MGQGGARQEFPVGWVTCAPVVLGPGQGWVSPHPWLLAQATLSPILQAWPGFLSYWPLPAQERAGAPWSFPEEHQLF